MTSLTDNQRAVLAVFADGKERPEFAAWNHIRRWPGHLGKPGGIYGYLGKLTERGYLSRSGNRGAFIWTITDAGREALA